MNILISGGSGSFGHAMTAHLLDKNAERIVIYSRDEVKQHAMAQKFNDERLRFFVGDVRDRDRLRRALEGVDIVIHAAALKRIDTGFYNPGEMVKTNIGGAVNLIEAAMDASVKKVVALSTDKAFQPISPYGQTKALAETLFLNANNTRGRNGPVFSVTRYGNVAGSRGSVIPLWRETLASSDTVPITNPDCTRFHMKMDEAIELVWTTMNGPCNSLVIPATLPAYKLGDLAEAMGAKTNIIGLPDYEKKHESLREGMCSEDAPRLSIDGIRQELAHV